MSWKMMLPFLSMKFWRLDCYITFSIRYGQLGQCMLITFLYFCCAISIVRGSFLELRSMASITLKHTFHETQHSVRVDRRTCWQTEWQTLFLGILKQINFLEHSLQNLGSWLTGKLCESPCNFLFEMDNLFVYTSYLFIFFSQILICLFCCNSCPCRMLSSNNLSGNLPEELGGLKNLTDL